MPNAIALAVLDAKQILATAPKESLGNVTNKTLAALISEVTRLSKANYESAMAELSTCFLRDPGYAHRYQQRILPHLVKAGCDPESAKNGLKDYIDHDFAVEVPE